MDKTSLLFILSVWTVLLNAMSIDCLNGNSTESQITRVRKRSYNPWSMPARVNSLSLYNAANIFKPAPYSIPRPYYIPVYGIPGGNLIFYPPQPIYMNPGIPRDNPVTPSYQGPPYLPPKAEPEPGLTENRFGMDDGDDDAPIWGTSGPVVQMPLNGGNQQESAIPPTRPPLSPLSTQPPLIRRPSENMESQRREIPSPSTQMPSTQVITGPSNCVWAIISCCSAAKPNVLPQNCFEQRGCPGPFWGSSPCNSEFARAAIAAAVDYYSRNPGAVPGK